MFCTFWSGIVYILDKKLTYFSQYVSSVYAIGSHSWVAREGLETWLPGSVNTATDNGTNLSPKVMEFLGSGLNL